MADRGAEDHPQLAPHLHFGWFALEDEAPNGKGTEVNRGLLTYKGKKKPAYYAFKKG